MSTPSQTVRQLAADIIDRWTKGEKPNTLAALELHPAIKEDKSAVLDLAFAEYWLRINAGEEVDLEAFCLRFPDYHVSLGRLLAQQSLKEKVDEASEEQRIPPTVQFPAVDAGEPAPGASSAPGAPAPSDKPRSSAVGSGSSFSTAGGAWPEAGIRIGDYNLVRAMGKGAFSRVYLAREETVDRTVVVKLSRQQCDEARVLGQLGHKNVVSVLSAPHDLSTGLFIIVMPYHGNSTLEDLLELAFPLRERSDPLQRPRQASIVLEAARRNRQPNDPEPVSLVPDPFLRKSSFVDGIVWIGTRMADALSAVHQSGFVHHDLKPSNVLLGLDGQPRLLDFNLATDARNSKSRLGGTLPYMPPEHLENVRSATTADQASMMDQRGDIFSLGVMLYELLAGVHPFGRFPKSRSVRKVAGDILARQKVGVRPIRELNPDVSGRLARLIEKCLAFKPDDRPASAAEVAKKLRHCFSTEKKVRQFLAGNSGRTAVLASSIGLVSAVGWMTTSRAGQPSGNVDHRLIARQAFDNKQYGLAALHLIPAISDSPNDAGLRAELGRVRLAQEDYTNARKDLESSLDLRPEDAPTLALYGWTLAKAGDLIAAEKTFEKLESIGYAPEQVKPLAAYVAIQRREDAVAAGKLRELLAAQPNDSMSLANHVYLEHLLAMSGGRLDLPETFQNVERLLKSAPADPKMYEWVARFYAWSVARPSGSNAAWSSDPELMRTKCREALKLAVEAGLPSAFWRDDTTFRAILGDAEAYSASWKIPARSETGQSYWRSGNPVNMFPQ